MLLEIGGGCIGPSSPEVSCTCVLPLSFAAELGPSGSTLLGIVEEDIGCFCAPVFTFGVDNRCRDCDCVLGWPIDGLLSSVMVSLPSEGCFGSLGVCCLVFLALSGVSGTDFC